MQYCIYLRKSRADAEAEARGEGESLARHETALMQTAKRLDLPVAGDIAHDGEIPVRCEAGGELTR